MDTPDLNAYAAYARKAALEFPDLRPVSFAAFLRFRDMCSKTRAIGPPSREFCDALRVIADIG